jgi:type I restriction enzyme R subunit
VEILAVIDWIHKDDVQREMRKKIKGVLRDNNYEFEEIEEMTPRIMDLARARLQK